MATYHAFRILPIFILPLLLILANFCLATVTQQTVSELKYRDYVVAGDYNITFYGLTFERKAYVIVEKNKTQIAAFVWEPADKSKNFSIDEGRLNLTVVDVLILEVPKETLLTINISVVGPIEVFRFKPQPKEKVTEEKICTPNQKRCSDNRLEQCSEAGTEWKLIEDCAYGCNATTLSCNPPPKEEKCEPCPLPSEWSECVNGTQKRTNYRCGPETNFKCVSYEDGRECKEVSYAPLAVAIATFSLIGLFLLIFWERVVRIIKRIR